MPGFSRLTVPNAVAAKVTLCMFLLKGIGAREYLFRFSLWRGFSVNVPCWKVRSPVKLATSVTPRGPSTTPASLA